MSTPTQPLPEKFTLELAKLPPHTEQDLRANAILRRVSPETLLASLVEKKLGGLFTVRAA